jgi:hypothetical protein
MGLSFDWTCSKLESYSKFNLENDCCQHTETVPSNCLYFWPRPTLKFVDSVSESQLYLPVKELPPLRIRDLFFSINNSNEKVRKVLARIIETVKGSSGVVINTFEALETNELERIRSEINNVPMVLAVGPLHKLSSTSTGSSLLDQDYSCIKWLDTLPV